MHGLGNFQVVREQAQIGVKASRGRIVIARAQMREAPHFAVFSAPHQQGQFAMRFQAHEAVVHLHSGFLQISRPSNVGSFVESRLQLDHHCHFFFGSRLHERTHDGRILAGAVQRLLDGQHIGIVHSALDKLHHSRIGSRRGDAANMTVLAQLIEHIAEAGHQVKLFGVKGRNFKSGRGVCS